MYVICHFCHMANMCALKVSLLLFVTPPKSTDFNLAQTIPSVMEQEVGYNLDRLLVYCKGNTERQTTICIAKKYLLLKAFILS